MLVQIKLMYRKSFHNQFIYLTKNKYCKIFHEYENKKCFYSDGVYIYRQK